MDGLYIPGSLSFSIDEERPARDWRESGQLDEIRVGNAFRMSCMYVYSDQRAGLYVLRGDCELGSKTD